MKKLFLLPCVLCVVLFLSCHVTSVPGVLAEDSVTAAQTEQVEQAETAEQTEVAEQAETTEQAEAEEQAEAAEQTDVAEQAGSDATSDDSTGSTDIVPDQEKSDDKSQPLTLADKIASTSEAAKKPLVIDGLVLTDAERRVFELTNIERKKRGLPALRLDRRLMESARRQANWMARTGIFRHGNSGYAENIAMGQRSGRDVVVAWLNSAGHFRNMMNRNHGAIGIGSYRGANGALFWCQQFSR